MKLLGSEEKDVRIELWGVLILRGWEEEKERLVGLELCERSV